MSEAIVVGSGPNGLAAAVVLAREGLSVTVLEGHDEIGGGTRTRELEVPGVLHDICSAVHPFGVASPFFRTLDLDRHGLTWRWADVDLAHPLDGGRAGVMVSSIDETAAGLGTDGPAWKHMFGPVARNLDRVTHEVFRPLAHVPRHPVALGRFGLRALQPATLAARRWEDDEARGLFAGVAAHSIQPLTHPATTAVGVLMIAAGHAFGWPVAKGGSQAISAALVSVLEEHGGKVETGVRVTSLRDLPRHDVVILDVAPRDAVTIAGDAMPARVQRAYRRWHHGAGAFKVDLVIDGDIPWTNEACRRAGTVHCGGRLEEIAAAERDVHRGVMPARPFVLVAQQYLADPGRSKGDLNPIWAYAHVPKGYDGDATAAVIDQIERFAPGLRERIVATTVHTPAQFEAYNPNYVGGDIATGENSVLQTAVRPRLAADPYATGVPGVYLCSAATPPGAGVHGMCGLEAATSALRHLGQPG